MVQRYLRAAALGAVVAIGWSCVARPDPFMGSPTRGQMITHFDLALDAREHAIRGDVAAFRSAASDLDALEPARDLPAEVILQLGPMRWEAREGARARTTAEATRAAAEIARTCGDCHAANDVPLGERFTVGGPPPAGSPGRHMAGLAWASRLLWDGLIGPSDLMWFTGAEGLVELGALPEGLQTAVPPSRVEAASERLRDLGRTATTLHDTQARVETLAEVWEECASCHAGVR
jgi:mono/diheme cytochrome c family protein